MEEPKKLFRSKQNRIIAGVCGGIGEYFGVDPVIVRIIFVLLTVWAGVGLILYLIGILIIPEAGEKAIIQSKNPGDFKEKVHLVTDEIKDSVSDKKGGNKTEQILGLILLLLGFVLLFNTFFPWISFNKLWPLLLVIIGISILISGTGKRQK